MAEGITEPQVNEEDVQQDDEQSQSEPEMISIEEADKRVEQEAERRLAKARKSWEAKFEERLEEAKSEGEKLAKMTAAEKEKAEQAKREEAFKQREAELNKRELTATVKDILIDKELPTDLTDILVKSGDADYINSAADSISKVIETRVNELVDKKLSGAGKPKGSSSDLDGTNDPFVAHANKYK